MSDSELRSLANALAQLARPYLEKNPPLRDALALLGHWLTETAHAAAAPKADAGQAANVLVAEKGTDSPPKIANEMAELKVAPLTYTVSDAVAVVPLRIGQAQVDIPVPGTAADHEQARRSAELRNDPPPAVALRPDPPATSLEVTERRCRLKAASCWLFIEKRAAADDPLAEAVVISRMREMIAEAKALPECFLWVFWRERTPPGDADLCQIAAGYEVQAEALAVLQRMEALDVREPETQQRALHLLAEANSALLAALGRSWLKDDRDQTEVHYWLRRETSLRGIYLGRHMSLENLADPAAFEERAERIREFGAWLDFREENARNVRGALSLIRYHSNQLLRSVEEESSNKDRKKIATAVAKLHGMGVPATDVRIADAIGQEAAKLLRMPPPEDPLLERCLDALDHRAAEADDSNEIAEPEAVWSERVLEVRELLRGRRMVIIGGEPRQAAMDRLSRAFELADIEWVDLTEHGPGQPMVAPIQRGDTALVTVIVRLTGHLHADEARACAANAGVACVLLAGGYNPERVAQEILGQASERLQQRVARAREATT